MTARKKRTDIVKRILIAAVFMMVGSTGWAQVGSGDRGSFPGCPTCGVYSYVDLPVAEMTVSASNFTLQGWGFECYSGVPADRVDLYYQDYDGLWHPLKQAAGTLWFGYVPRPDVAAAYRSSCPNVSDTTGWGLTVMNPPPVGLRRIQINVWHGPYFESHRRTYLIVP